MEHQQNKLEKEGNMWDINNAAQRFEEGKR